MTLIAQNDFLIFFQWLKPLLVREIGLIFLDKLTSASASDQ